MQKENKKHQTEKISCESDFYDEAVKPVCTNAKHFLVFSKALLKNKRRCFSGLKGGNASEPRQ